jgi:hypothetical protein
VRSNVLSRRTSLCAASTHDSLARLVWSTSLRVLHVCPRSYDDSLHTCFEQQSNPGKVGGKGPKNRSTGDDPLSPQSPFHSVFVTRTPSQKNMEGSLVGRQNVNRPLASRLGASVGVRRKRFCGCGGRSLMCVRRPSHCTAGPKPGGAWGAWDCELPNPLPLGCRSRCTSFCPIVACRGGVIKKRLTLATLWAGGEPLLLRRASLVSPALPNRCYCCCCVKSVMGWDEWIMAPMDGMCVRFLARPFPYFAPLLPIKSALSWPSHTQRSMPYLLRFLLKMEPTPTSTASQSSNTSRSTVETGPLPIING